MDKDQHDLLIRIDERVAETARRVEKIETVVGILPCQTQIEKLKTIEKITWTAVAASVVAMTRSFWGSFST